MYRTEGRALASQRVQGYKKHLNIPLLGAACTYAGGEAVVRLPLHTTHLSALECGREGTADCLNALAAILSAFERPLLALRLNDWLRSAGSQVEQLVKQAGPIETYAT